MDTSRSRIYLDTTGDDSGEERLMDPTEFMSTMTRYRFVTRIRTAWLLSLHFHGYMSTNEIYMILREILTEIERYQTSWSDEIIIYRERD